MNLKIVFGLVVLSLGTAAFAQVGVDGNYGAEWTGVTATHISHDDSAAESNFSTPGTTNKGADYDIYLRTDGTYLYGLLTVTGNAASAPGIFANLYFDLNPSAGDGSDWGMEVTNNRAFVPGVAGFYDLSSALTYATSTTGVEFALKWSYLMDGANPDIAYYGAGPVAPGGNVALRLSQSFGYSVVGGNNYGVNMLGTVTAPAATAVPGPSAVLAFGLGLVRSRRRRASK